MRKKKTSLFDREMQRDSFRDLFSEAKKEFALEIQILKALEENHLTYKEFANLVGTQKANVSRDLKVGGLSRATLQRIYKMAHALKMDFFPLLVPKSKEKRKEKISQVLRLLEAR